MVSRQQILKSKKALCIVLVSSTFTRALTCGGVYRRVGRFERKRQRQGQLAAFGALQVATDQTRHRF